MVARDRFVKPTAANDVASTRCSASPCDDTSMATTCVPASRISASICWRSVASGVVRAPVRVPMTPVGVPWCSRIAWIMRTVVVLPFVPVTPTTRIARDG